MDDNARSEEFCYTRLASGNSIAKQDSVLRLSVKRVRKIPILEQKYLLAVIAST